MGDPIVSNVAEVRFDHAAAAELVAELRATAAFVDHQGGERSRVGGQAQQHWRGTYRQQFDQRLATCAKDAHMLADKLRMMVNLLGQAADQARAEQARREQARLEEAERDDRSTWKRFGDLLNPLH